MMEISVSRRETACNQVTSSLLLSIAGGLAGEEQWLPNAVDLFIYSHKVTCFFFFFLLVGISRADRYPLDETAGTYKFQITNGRTNRQTDRLKPSRKTRTYTGTNPQRYHVRQVPGTRYQVSRYYTRTQLVYFADPGSSHTWESLHHVSEGVRPAMIVVSKPSV